MGDGWIVRSTGGCGGSRRTVFGWCLGGWVGGCTIGEWSGVSMGGLVGVLVGLYVGVERWRMFLVGRRVSL